MSHAKHYLYVEDDPKSREIMRLMLERVVKDCTYSIWEDGADFMSRLKELPEVPAMIMLDIHMAPVDGFTILRQIRAEPNYAHIPIVALTASVMNEEVEKLRESGFNGVIAKPINPHYFPQLLVKLSSGEAVWQATS